MNYPAENTTDVFSTLSPDDLALLSSLPYRVGLFVSFSDLGGGWSAQEQEQEMLGSILREFSEDFCKGEFAQKVLFETISQKSRWPEWSQNIDKVPSDAIRAINFLEHNLSEKNIYDFKVVLFDISVAVAMAFREGDGGPQQSPIASLFGNIVESFSKKMGFSKNNLSHVNVSSSERAALLKLSNALGYKP